MKYAVAFLLLVVAAVALHFEVERENAERYAAWRSCLPMGHAIAPCLTARGYRFHGSDFCGPQFASRHVAPFCYEPTAWYPRQIFWLGQRFTIFALS